MSDERVRGGQESRLNDLCSVVGRMMFTIVLVKLDMTNRSITIILARYVVKHHV